MEAAQRGGSRPRSTTFFFFFWRSDGAADVRGAPGSTQVTVSDTAAPGEEAPLRRAPDALTAEQFDNRTYADNVRRRAAHAGKAAFHASRVTDTKPFRRAARDPAHGNANARTTNLCGAQADHGRHIEDARTWPAADELDQVRRSRENGRRRRRHRAKQTFTVNNPCPAQRADPGP